LLRWALDHGVVIIPKSSSSKERQKENYDILDFQLSSEELDRLDHVTSDQEFDEYWDPVEEAEVDVGDLELAKIIREEEEEEEL
jgi:diketogulonate reductase-like aldo/keto reductase